MLWTGQREDATTGPRWRFPTVCPTARNGIRKGNDLRFQLYPRFALARSRLSIYPTSIWLACCLEHLGLGICIPACRRTWSWFCSIWTRYFPCRSPKIWVIAIACSQGISTSISSEWPLNQRSYCMIRSRVGLLADFASRPTSIAENLQTDLGGRLNGIDLISWLIECTSILLPNSAYASLLLHNLAVIVFSNRMQEVSDLHILRFVDYKEGNCNALCYASYVLGISWSGEYIGGFAKLHPFSLLASFWRYIFGHSKFCRFCVWVALDRGQGREEGERGLGLGRMLMPYVICIWITSFHLLW
jgi:hypothetical protein